MTKGNYQAIRDRYPARTNPPEVNPFLENDHTLVLAIQEKLDGVEWSPDTLEEIAALLIRHGYRIRDKNDADREPNDD